MGSAWRCFRTGLSALAAVLAALLVALGSPAQAQVEDDEIAALQYLLLWTGDYAGLVDGRSDELLLHAIREFQARASLRPTGRLETAHLSRLAAEAQRAADQVGYIQAQDARTGAYIGLPGKLVKAPRPSESGAEFASESGSVRIITFRYQSNERSLLQVYRSMTKELEGRSLGTNAFRGDYFDLFWFDAGRVNAVRVQDRFGDIRGIQVSVERAAHPQAHAIAAASLRDFAPFNDAPRPELMRLPKLPAIAMAPKGGKGGRPVPARPERPDPEEGGGGGGISSGSGFVVSARGHILTNAHVVRDCLNIAVDKNPVRLVAMDVPGDLALLLDPTRRGDAFARFAREPVRLGEEIAVFGFPLRSILANQLNMTTGGVSSLAGLGGNPKFIQITAPVQRGNSGGPLVDLAGRVLGVVTSKLDALGIAAQTGGDLPQAVNFAIRAELAMRFLSRNGVEPEVLPQSPPLKGTDLASHASGFTVPIVCGRN